ncbi:MAG: hypothetical protein JNM00_11635 [Flavobacteriales bacterium]|nr:hypothetical protein [Flavobacteriales bacterium]
MLDFCKEILTKVSFDRLLFRKELDKAIQWLRSNKEDLLQFRQWCLDQFGGKYSDIIMTSFRPVLA